MPPRSTARWARRTSSLKVFQDFFVDLDLPVTLTQGDRVSIPVAVYNYSGARGDVNLKLQAGRLVLAGRRRRREDRRGRFGPRGRLAVHPRSQAHRQIQADARRAHERRSRHSRADIVVREIEVVPNGREQNVVFNGRLETTRAARTSTSRRPPFPMPARSSSGSIPARLSQVVEGMDAILRMPCGCFEQTSSSTYPNVLALDYMKRTKKLTPEVHAKAEASSPTAISAC